MHLRMQLKKSRRINWNASIINQLCIHENEGNNSNDSIVDLVTNMITKNYAFFSASNSVIIVNMHKYIIKIGNCTMEKRKLRRPCPSFIFTRQRYQRHL